MIANFTSLPADTQIRFLDIPSLEQKPLTAEQQAQYADLLPEMRGVSKNTVVSAHRIVDGKPVERVQLLMARTTLDTINAIAKGEQ